MCLCPIFWHLMFSCFSKYFALQTFFCYFVSFSSLHLFLNTFSFFRFPCQYHALIYYPFWSFRELICHSKENWSFFHISDVKLSISVYYHLQYSFPGPLALFCGHEQVCYGRWIIFSLVDVVSALNEKSKLKGRRKQVNTNNIFTIWYR